ncbi:hypothetical protein DEU56DRAFT_978800 [Suillus clintonianus]|uniref:uncharacterized protein n=1 Tax=Suillus clintonianus TaxID=1904413 RepID=UPI001B8633A8|nr:uncharacterized protein DEU56DRAFT_978800 [Suillus clintonianus]KAG2146345.1 hypothetical protein DEU56DRAFT_978800 [Suillus clintonianus]
MYSKPRRWSARVSHKLAVLAVCSGFRMGWRSVSRCGLIGHIYRVKRRGSAMCLSFGRRTVTHYGRHSSPLQVITQPALLAWSMGHCQDGSHSSREKPFAFGRHT